MLKLRIEAQEETGKTGDHFSQCLQLSVKTVLTD